MRHAGYAVLVIAAGLMSASAVAQVKVTPENFARADVDGAFQNVVAEVGSNRFRHDRSVIPLDKQPAVTMNRDTVYSFGIFHAPKGTVVTLPKSKDGRYQSAMILQNDHYIDQVFYGAGPHEIVAATPFVGIVIRTQVDPSDPDDLKYVNSLQDQIEVTWPKGTQVKSFKPGNWDKASLDAVRAQYQQKAKALPNLNGTSGARGKVDPEMQRMGVAIALGLLPPQHAVYINKEYGLSGSKCYRATYTPPPFGEKGFFSLTMYGADKYLKDEESHLSNKQLKLDPDGSFTVFYGSAAACGAVANRINTPTDNWFLVMRVYRPGKAVVDGKYDLPKPQEVTRQ